MCMGRTSSFLGLKMHLAVRDFHGDEPVSSHENSISFQLKKV